MKSLLTLINDYKNNPNEYLSNKIWSFLLNEKNGHYFEKIDACKDENDWIEYGEYLRIKMISNNLFVATEIARNTFGGYFCFLYLIDVRDYTDEQLKEAMDLFPEYRDVFDDERFYAIASIAAALSVDDAKVTYLAEDDIALEAWIARMEDEYFPKADKE